MVPQRIFPPAIKAAVTSPPPDAPSPNIDRINEAKAAIDQTREKNRKSQRRSRMARGAFAGGDEAMTFPGRIPDATADTLQVYMDRGHALYKRYKREQGLGVSKEDADPCDFVTWLLGVRPFWNESTWRANRIAACMFINSVPHERSDEALALLESATGRSLYPYRPLTGEVTDTPSVTACRMDYNHLEKIRRALLLQTRGEAVSWLDDWLVAGLFTGVGPDEWSLTEIERRPNEDAGERFWLHVINANATQVGHRGSYRTLDLSKFSAEARDAVARMADRARQWTLAGSFAQRKSEVSRLLGTTSKVLIERMKLRYDLESLQHQFVANMRTVYSRENISALIGELFIEDQPANYTNRRRAWDDKDIVEIPIPLKDDVERFRRILEIFEERRVLRELRGKSIERGISR
jgi:hypothetical protein